jgi:hypothetical protein
LHQSGTISAPDKGADPRSAWVSPGLAFGARVVEGRMPGVEGTVATVLGVTFCHVAELLNKSRKRFRKG